MGCQDRFLFFFFLTCLFPFLALPTDLMVPDGQEEFELGGGFRTNQLDVFVPANLVSEMAYRTHSVAKDKKIDATEAARLAYAGMKNEYAERARTGSREDKFMAKRSVDFLDTLNVDRATEDAVAFTQKVGNTEKLVVGFRGTATSRDLIPDAQLALNAKKIGRLEEAKEFVNELRKQHPEVAQKDMDFYGHSLGGFIAEGVRSFHPGARAIVMSPGTPRVGKDKGINAYQKYDQAAETKALGKRDWTAKRIVRIRTQGDPVAAMGGTPSTNIVAARRENGGLNPIANHKLGIVDSESFRHFAGNVVQSSSNHMDKSGKVRDTTTDEFTDESFLSRARRAMGKVVNKVSQKVLKRNLVDVKRYVPVDRRTGVDLNLGFNPDRSAHMVASPAPQVPAPSQNGVTGSKCGFDENLGFDPCDAPVARSPVPAPERKFAASGGKNCGFDEGLGFDPCDSPMSQPKKKQRSEAQRADIQGRWDARKADRLAKQGKKTVRAPRTPQAEAAIRARWNARKTARSASRSSASSSSYGRPARTAQQGAAIQARWNARKSSRARVPSAPRRAPRTTQQRAAIQARWNARRTQRNYR